MTDHAPAPIQEEVMSDTTAMLERTAQITAHRACCGTEHDPANGKIHGYCVVCGVDWPCEYAGPPPSAWDGWTPTAANINALPEPVRRYIMYLSTEADPAGTIRENVLVREENQMLRALIADCDRVSETLDAAKAITLDPAVAALAGQADAEPVAALNVTEANAGDGWIDCVPLTSAGRSLPVGTYRLYTTPPAAIQADALRGLAEKWRAYAGEYPDRDEWHAAHADCADELNALIAGATP